MSCVFVTWYSRVSKDNINNAEHLQKYSKLYQNKQNQADFNLPLWVELCNSITTAKGVKLINQIIKDIVFSNTIWNV